MSLSSLKGAIGVGAQSAKGISADPASMVYLPVMNANVMGDQMAQNVPPEVGGTYFSRGAYKAALRSRGELALNMRPNTIGWLFTSLLNREQVSAVGGGSNLYDHKFTVGDSSAYPHRWLTVNRMVNNAYGEQMSDGRVGSFRIDVAAANIAQASVQLIGGQHGEIAGADVVAQDGPVFVTCAADVTEGGAPFIVDRIGVELGAQLTDNEFRVGSYYLDDITLLQRAVTIQADVRIKARDLWAKVYRNNGAAPTGSGIGAWSPVLYRTGLVLTLQTAETTPQFLKIEIPGIDFLTLPVQMQGADLIRAQLSASVTLASDNFDSTNLDHATKQPLIVTLRNGKSTKHTWDGN